MAKSRTRAKADKAEAVGRKNLIINGAMQVWQRGTSFDVTGSTYTTDRWQGRDAVLSQSTDVPANEGFRYSAFYDNDGTRSAINFRQIVEDGKLYTDNKEITLSFWVKGSVASSGCTVDFGDQQYTSFPLTTEWNRVTLTVPSYVRNTSNLFNGGLYIDWNFGADYPDVYITGVQLELGPVATEFEHRSYGEELALCQRYYIRYNYSDFSMVASYWNTSEHYGTVNFPVSMRTDPTLIKSRDACLRVFGHGGSTTCTQVVLDQEGPNLVEVRVYSTRNEEAVFTRIESSSDYLAFEAEL